MMSDPDDRQQPKGTTPQPGNSVEALRLAMEQAARDGDFETAAVLRDRISLLRGTEAGSAPDEIDSAGLVRQRPGAMGLGTSQQRMTPPTGWVRPQKPDPMTKGRSRTGKRGT